LIRFILEVTVRNPDTYRPHADHAAEDERLTSAPLRSSWAIMDWSDWCDL
jgi:hypothetical protein